MSDDALIAWLNAGAPAQLSVDEESARRRSEFARRLVAPLNTEPATTEDECEAIISKEIYAAHLALMSWGDEEYSRVWREISASNRRAIKAYIEIARLPK